ncbi:hypothetical protein F4801DRAFT_363427 [Xylaria longipes]|nr:hypothetical protein F4801DRAFT_363427 [Xylaria longipes]RYC58814.1 hypothetical protein CHU98_g7393 [Xylaria longipes]
MLGRDISIETPGVGTERTCTEVLEMPPIRGDSSGNGTPGLYSRAPIRQTGGSKDALAQHWVARGLPAAAMGLGQATAAGYSAETDKGMTEQLFVQAGLGPSGRGSRNSTAQRSYSVAAVGIARRGTQWSRPLQVVT